QAGRPAGATANQVQAGGQPQDRQSARADDPAVNPRARGRGHRMNRRGALVGGALALLIAPKPSVSQQPQAKILRVGVLTQASNDRAPMFDAFRGGLRDLGYVEGRNIILEFRFAGGDPAQGRRLAAELVALPVDVIVAEGFTPDAVAASERIPIVC